MSKKRSLNQMLEENDSESLQCKPAKRRKIDKNEEIAMITVMVYYGYDFNALSYRPFWISGNSSTNRFEEYQDGRYSFNPSQFLNECQYPLLRFCDIPKHVIEPKQFLSVYHIYDYNHCLSIQHTINYNAEIVKFINYRINALFDEIINKNKDGGCLMHKKDNLLCHLFIIKEYYKTFKIYYNEYINNKHNKSLLNMLSDDIIKYYLSDYIPELQILKDIDYLNDDTKINQNKWFKYTFFFIEFASKSWQQFFYEMVLQNKYNNNQYDEAAIEFIKKRKKLGFRHLKYRKITAFAIKMYKKSGNAFKSQNIAGFIHYSLKNNDEDLFKLSMDLLDSIKPNLFWGGILYQNVRNIDGDSLRLFNKICIKMKEHCNKNDKIIKDSLNKFNTKTMKCDHWNDDQLQCVKIMENILNYDVNTIIKDCCFSNNLEFIQCLIEQDMVDYNICKNNGYLDGWMGATN